MIAETISVEEHIAALKGRSFEDQMRVIAALSNEWAEAKTPVKPTPEVSDNSGPTKGKLDVVEAAGAELTPDEIAEGLPVDATEIKRTTEVKKEESFYSLFGAWKDSTPDNLMEIIREDRGPGAL